MPKLWISPSFGFLRCLGSGFALHLLVDFVSHSEAAGADRVTKALQAAVRVDCQFAV